MEIILLLAAVGIVLVWGRSRFKRLPRGDPRDYEVMLTPDASGSMKGKKNQDSKRAQKAFMDSMPLPRCRIGVIAFRGRKASFLHPLSPNHEQARSAIDQIKAEGSTPFYDGLKRSYEQLTPDSGSKLLTRLLGGASPDSDSTRVIVMSSDGHNNVGPGKDQILQLGRKIKGEGIRIITIAIGNRADRNLLRNLASSPDDFHIAQYSGKLKEVYQQVASDITPLSGT